MAQFGALHKLLYSVTKEEKLKTTYTVTGIHHLIPYRAIKPERLLHLIPYRAIKPERLLHLIPYRAIQPERPLHVDPLLILSNRCQHLQRYRGAVPRPRQHRKWSNVHNVAIDTYLVATASFTGPWTYVTRVLINITMYVPAFMSLEHEQLPRPVRYVIYLKLKKCTYTKLEKRFLFHSGKNYNCPSNGRSTESRFNNKTQTDTGAR